jgi:hypothetical protein
MALGASPSHEAASMLAGLRRSGVEMRLLSLTVAGAAQAWSGGSKPFGSRDAPVSRLTRPKDFGRAPVNGKASLAYSEV